MRAIRFAFAFVLGAALVHAHVGSPDIYLDAKAGTYQLFVTVQPPPAIPGVAQIQVRSHSAQLTHVTATPLRMTGAGSKLAPIADVLQPSRDDAQFFTGAVWLMQTGSSQIRLNVLGAAGPGEVSVPVPAIAQSTKAMPGGLEFLLFGLMLLLAAGLVAIVVASTVEAQLPPGASPDSQSRRRGRWVMIGTTLLVIAMIWGGKNWWGDEAAAYNHYIYKPLQMAATTESGGVLQLQITDPGWLRWRKIDDFIPDHGHLMHLYVIRDPAIDVVFHLHPEMTGAGTFSLKLPTMDAGRYRLYADVVHQDGFPETLTAAVDLPTTLGRALSGDDAVGRAQPISNGSAENTEMVFPDGYRMIWLRSHEPLEAKRPELFRFKLLDPHHNKPGDMALYMGMIGHAAFIDTDGTVFAHIHPNGTVAMAAFMMAQDSSAANRVNISPVKVQSMSMSGDTAGTSHDFALDALPNEASFPYGFPKPGHYRIAVQMKHGRTIETGIFDATVVAPKTKGQA